MLGHVLETMAHLFEQKRVLDLSAMDLPDDMDAHVRQHVHVELGVGEDPNLVGVCEDVLEVRQHARVQRAAPVAPCEGPEEDLLVEDDETRGLGVCRNLYG